eukprot:429504_1
MVNVINLNPFTNIICAPFYQIWVIVLVSWILSTIEMLFMHLIHKRDQKMWNHIRLDTIENKVENLHRDAIELELEQILIDNEPLPDDIIYLILDMLPNKTNRWWSLRPGKRTINSIYWKSKIVEYTQCIYPCIRILANIINSVILIIHYIHWYMNNNTLSHWDKYCGLIITFFYLPNWKAKSTFNAFWVMEGHNCQGTWFGDTITENIASMDLYIEITFILWFLIISIPIFISGMFIFIPTIIIGLLWGLLAFIIISKLLLRCFDNDNITDTAGIIVSISIALMWLFVVTIMSTIEFFKTKDWIGAYRIGFLGEYCNESDYFQFDKWNKYPMDIQFVIISWFLF